jgi:hydroxymethylbilane synthase
VAAPLRIATRGSPLARAQAELVADLLSAAGCSVELVLVETTGDRRSDLEIWQLGGRGVFVKEVQVAVLEGRADVAVHSAKDLPSRTPPGLVIAAVPERGDPRDALVGRRLDALHPGALVATGSVRRRAQLSWLRPDLTFAGIRGNVGTRLDAASEFDAVVLAVAGLERLGRQSRVAEYLDPRVVVPQVGQGALALECRADDADTRRLLSSVEHPATRAAVDAERAFLGTIGGGCDRPVGAHATVTGEGSDMRVRVTGMLATADGRVLMRHSEVGENAPVVGRRVAEELLESGGRSLLEVG